jgi:drug/metabolite transporter (DMT)-like permease
VFALLAAFAYATSNVLEQRKAAEAPPDTSMRIGLLWHLARQPSWWLGIASDLAGFAAQAIALLLGSLVFVQPMLVTSLLFSLTLGAALGLHRLTRRDVIAALALVASLSIFLALSAVTGDHSTRPPSDWLVPGVAVAGAVAACITLAHRTSGPLRAALLGAGAGATFGVSSTLLKSFSFLLDHEGVPGMLRHWEPYALGVVVAFGFLEVQSAFQAGDLRASLPALEVAEPLVASVLGVTLMGERFHAGGVGAKVAITVAVVVMTWAAIQLAGSAAGDRELAEQGLPLSEPSSSPPGLQPGGTELR